MSHLAQSALFIRGNRFQRRWIAFVACALTALLAATALRAQEAPPNAIGRITGPDLTVESASAAGSGLPSTAPSIFVLPGSIITVHSGQAQLEFFSGGRLDICGPAKFTVLESSGAFTVALNFGKLRIQLPAATPLKIYTPTIVATPLDIGGGPRDVTVGLDLQDSLCVHPATGALQLESQFTGEKIIAPENSEFFLAGGKLAPVAGTPGSCLCVAEQAVAAPPPVPPSVAAISTKPIPLPPPKPGQTLPPSGAATPPDVDAPPVTYAVPIETPSPNLPKPAEPTPAVAPASKTPPAEAETQQSPVYQVSSPAMIYRAPSGLEPSQPSVQTLLLVTQARVQPDYDFHGEVAPEFAAAMQNALGEKPATPASSATNNSSAAQPGAAGSGTTSAPAGKKKGGFWSKLKRVFGGS